MIELELLTNDPDLRDICEQYWKLDDEAEFVGTVRRIAQEEGLSSSELLALVRENSVARSISINCSECGKALVFTSRTDFKSGYRSTPYVCKDCREKKREERKKALRRKKELKRESIYQTFAPQSYEQPNLRDLPLDAVVYLLSFIRAGATEDLSKVRALKNFQEPLTPRKEYDFELLRTLQDWNLIKVHPQSPIEAFDFKDGKPVRYYYMDVNWQLTIGNDLPEVREVIAELERVFKDMDWTSHWIDESLPLWRKVALHESLEYLEHKLDEHNIPLEPQDRTYSVIENLLDDFSVSQVYNLIWRKVRDAAAFLSRTPAPRKRGGDYAVVSLQKHGDRARKEGWEVKKFGRDWSCPQSMLSAVLYDAVLQTDGFNNVPG